MCARWWKGCCGWVHTCPRRICLKTEGWGLCVCFQVDELYEAFCIQSRLREGASRMKQAFSSSPSTKGTKESIAEVNRRYKEYTEVLADTTILTTETSVCIKTLTQSHLKSVGNYLTIKLTRGKRKKNEAFWRLNLPKIWGCSLNTESHRGRGLLTLSVNTCTYSKIFREWVTHTHTLIITCPDMTGMFRQCLWEALITASCCVTTGRVCDQSDACPPTEHEHIWERAGEPARGVSYQNERWD